MPEQSTKNQASPRRPAPVDLRATGASPVRISFNQQILIAYAEQVAILERKAEELQRQVLELRQLLDHYQSTDPKPR